MRRGTSSARAQLQARRETARAVPADGATAEGAPTDVEEPWTRRVAAWTGAFTEGLELPARNARLGAFVRAHLGPARWTGIAIGAVVLLFWPEPTLSVLIWVAALVALYLGALEWLQGRAPQQDAALDAAGTPSPVTSAAVQPVVPAPRPASEPLVPAELTPAVMSTLSDRLDLLVRLKAAREAGVLTDDEFTREKSRLLGV